MQGAPQNLSPVDRAEDISAKAAANLPLQSSGRDLSRKQREIIWTAFRNHEALSAWPEAVLNTLVEAGFLRTYADGELIYLANDPCTDIHIILSGMHEWGWPSTQGIRAVETFIPPGELANLTAVMTDQRSIHNQRARGLTRLFHIPADALNAALERDPTLTASLLRLLATRARHLHDCLGNLGLMSFRARLAGHLLALGKRYGHTDNNGVTLGIRLSQEDLAALLMASRQHVNKELRWFIDRQLVRIRYGRITLVDTAELESIVRQPPAHSIEPFEPHRSV